MAAKSIELRICGDHVVCDWGIIEHPEPRPDLNQVGPLMLSTTDYVAQLLHQPGAFNVPPRGPGIGFHSVTEHDGRLFAHHDYNGRRWTWELHPAHWSDNLPDTLLVGRWPD